MAQFKRKKKLINSSLQLKMIGVFLAVSGTCALFQVVLLNKAILGLSEKLPETGDLLLAELPSILLRNILLTSGVLIPLTFAIGLVVTHRIAGPAYRMTEFCKAVASGEETGLCNIRKDDELKDLCAALNAAMTYLRGDVEDVSAEESLDAVDSLAEPPEFSEEEAA